MPDRLELREPVVIRLTVLEVLHPSEIVAADVRGLEARAARVFSSEESHRQRSTVDARQLSRFAQREHRGMILEDVQLVLHTGALFPRRESRRTLAVVGAAPVL